MGAFAFSDLLACYGDDEGAGMWSGAVLPEEEPLPCAKQERALGEWNEFRTPRKGHLDMAGHIVRPFVGVGEMSIVVGNQSIHKSLEIMAGTGIGVFHQYEAAAGVAAKDV